MKEPEYEQVSVIELRPGDEVRLGAPPGFSPAVFIVQTRHPLYSNMQLVIWALANGTLSMDALVMNQHVGERLVNEPDIVRRNRLLSVLLGVHYKRVEDA